MLRAVQAWPARVVLFHRFAAAAVGFAAGLAATVVGGHAGWSAVGVVVAAGYYAASTRRFRRRQALLSEPMAEAHRRILRERVPFYRRLDEPAQRRFEDDVRVFLAEQVITGARDHEVDTATRLLVGASAAMLTNGLPEWEWPRMRDIVVYPGAFDDRYDVDRRGDVAGQVHLYGPVILSERDLKLGFRHRDGHNVGLHELAHVMDMEDGHADGVPADAPFTASAPWIDVVARRLRGLRQGQKSALRPYAGTNEAEVFAVAVEVFFEKPTELARRDPELFELLRAYFNQDPRRPGEAG